MAQELGSFFPFSPPSIIGSPDFKPTSIPLITMKLTMRLLVVLHRRRFLEFSKRSTNSPCPLSPLTVHPKLVPPILSILPFVWSRWNLLWVLFFSFLIVNFWNFWLIPKVFLLFHHGPYPRNTLSEFYRISISRCMWSSHYLSSISFGIFNYFKKFCFPSSVDQNPKFFI